MAGVDGVARTATGTGARLDVDGASAGRREASASLPAPGERLTEDQMCERFGVGKLGGIRISRTSRTIVLVDQADVEAQSKNAGRGEYVVFNGWNDSNSSDQAACSEDLILANSGKEGYEVLYFVRDRGMLAFAGRVECISSMPVPGNDERPGLGASFKLRLAGGARNAHSMPVDASLDSIEMVESALSSARRFDTRRALLESLPRRVSSRSLDRMLDYLVRSGKVDVEGGSVRWIFAGRPAVEETEQIVESYLETLDILTDPDLAAASIQPVA